MPLCCCGHDAVLHRTGYGAACQGLFCKCRGYAEEHTVAELKNRIRRLEAELAEAQAVAAKARRLAEERHVAYVRLEVALESERRKREIAERRLSEQGGNETLDRVLALRAELERASGVLAKLAAVRDNYHATGYWPTNTEIISLCDFARKALEGMGK